MLYIGVLWCHQTSRSLKWCLCCLLSSPLSKRGAVAYHANHRTTTECWVCRQRSACIVDKIAAVVRNHARISASECMQKRFAKRPEWAVSNQVRLQLVALRPSLHMAAMWHGHVTGRAAQQRLSRLLSTTEQIDNPLHVVRGLPEHDFAKKIRHTVVAELSGPVPSR